MTRPKRPSKNEIIKQTDKAFNAVKSSPLHPPIYELLENIKRPEQCSQQEKEIFFQYVDEGGKDDINGLDGKIERAQWLAFYKIGDDICSIAAIKTPSKNYKDSVFENADASKYANYYTYELGYLFTRKNNRRNHMADMLVKLLLTKSEIKSLYATTDSPFVMKILERNKFFRLGKPYQGRSSILYLYVTNPE